jgi:hypothetical protein
MQFVDRRMSRFMTERLSKQLWRARQQKGRKPDFTLIWSTAPDGRSKPGAEGDTEARTQIRQIPDS